MSKQVSINLMLNLGVPSKSDSSKSAHKHRSCIVDNVKSAICMCESGEDSAKEWEYLQAVFKLLSEKSELNERQKELLQLIEPFLRRHNSANGGSYQQSTEKAAENNSLFKL